MVACTRFTLHLPSARSTQIGLKLDLEPTHVRVGVLDGGRVALLEGVAQEPPHEGALAHVADAEEDHAVLVVLRVHARRLAALASAGGLPLSRLGTTRTVAL